MMQMVHDGGFMGLLVIVSAVTVLITGVVLLVRRAMRKAYTMLLVVACLPLLFGVLGTWLGQMQIAEFAERADLNKIELAAGHEAARSTIWMGLFGGLLAGAPAVIGLLRSGTSRTDG